MSRRCRSTSSWTTTAAAIDRFGQDTARRRTDRPLGRRLKDILGSNNRTSNLESIVRVEGVGESMLLIGIHVERPQHQKGAAMNHYAGLDVSLEETSICVV